MFFLLYLLCFKPNKFLVYNRNYHFVSYYKNIKMSDQYSKCPPKNTCAHDTSCFLAQSGFPKLNAGKGSH